MEKRLTGGRTGGRTSKSAAFRIAADRRVTANLVSDGELRPPFDF